MAVKAEDFAQTAEAPDLVERRGGIQLWRQIADRIRQSISLGEFGDSAVMPSEMALAARYGVNRHTVRSALAALARAGLVRAEQGRGTMILRRERLSYPISRRTRFSSGLAGQAENVTLVACGGGPVAASSSVAAALSIPVGTPCIALETLGSADGVAISRASHVFAGARFEPLPEHFARLGSITAALAELGIRDYVRLSTDVIARSALAEEAAALNITPGAILLETVSVNGEPDGTAFQLSRTCFPADSVKLSIYSDA